MAQHNDTALLIMDYQAGITDKYPTINELAEKVNHATSAARKAGIKVIFCKVGFRDGHPEIGEYSMPSFQNIKKNNMMTGEQSHLIPALKLMPTDLVIDKKRFSAFAGNDLSLILRASGIRHLVLAGVRTAGVVLSTIRAAADEDYRITVLKDCCADPDPEIHRVLMEKVFTMQAGVTDCDSWIKTL